MNDTAEQIVDRIGAAHPRPIDLTLDRLRRLLARLDHPERRLPLVIHVAGTNGKGSACAFMRGMAEAAGQRVHVYTSPHLVHFNERIRIAGSLVTDDRLIACLHHIEQVNDGAPITRFEVITAAAFDLFAETPADVCVLEVGVGGRGDATNVIETPSACAITSISLDHQDLLGPSVDIIAGEKAGIMKPNVPVAIGTQPADVRAILLAHANAVGAPVMLRGRDWDITVTASGLRYADRAGTIDGPVPALPGLFQQDNTGIALTALRAASLPHNPDGLARADWPARLQHLHGKLAHLLPPDWELWLDGGHNPGASLVLAEHLRGWADRPVHLVVGLKQTKDARQFLRPLLPLAETIWAVQEPGQYDSLPIEAIVDASGGVARPGPRVTDALRNLPRASKAARVLICGSLYLAGEVLKLDQ